VPLPDHRGDGHLGVVAYEMIDWRRWAEDIVIQAWLVLLFAAVLKGCG